MTTAQIKIESSHTGLHIAKSQHGSVLVLWKPEDEYVDALKKLEARLGFEFKRRIIEEFEREIRALAESYGLYVEEPNRQTPKE